ncbi:antifreeze protein [Mycena latifolia]|nr:antifreeze protein [Mycena latifolia]
MISSIFTISFLATLSSVTAVGPVAVNLRTAANYVILGSSGVSTVPPSVITGSVAVSPVAGTALTGFSFTLDSTGQFSTSSQVVGKLFAADTGTAYTDAIGRPTPDFLNLGAGSIGGRILTPGLYNWGSVVTIDSDITIAGGATDRTLNIGTGVKMTLTGGALAKNVVWVATGAITAGTTSHFAGVVLGKTGITLQTGATAQGRLLAQTLVALQKSTVSN